MHLPLPVILARVFTFALIAGYSCPCLEAQVSSLVYPGSDGKLVYAGYANEGQSNRGNLMIDFSHAGYRGGGVAIPWVPVAVELKPLAGGTDDHARIQAAIEVVENLPLSSAGFRGCLLLRAGTYQVSETLRITESGVVIRGEGQGSDGTIIRFTATEQDDLFEFVGKSGWSRINGKDSPITSPVVPCGTRTFTVASPENFEIGDRVMVHRTPNETWIADLEMAQWGWTPSAYRSVSPRTITSMEGNTITLDAPLVHAIEERYGGGEVYAYHFDGAIRQAGIERLRMESAFASETDEDHGWHAVTFMRAENAWARQLTAKYFGHACVNVDERSQYVTVEDCAQLDPKSNIAGGRRYSFVLDDSCFVLVQRCYTRRGRHDYVTHSKMGGPSAFVDSLAENTLSDIGPHHRYAEGILFDNIKGGQINVQNRTSSGTGHGWAGSQIVLWNCSANSLVCQAPKAAMNFAIGCAGTQARGSFSPSEPHGFWESRGSPVTPRSLYYKQLEDRLGLQALMTVTTPHQHEGNLWAELSDWGGEAEAPGLPTFAPLQVEVGAEPSAYRGAAHQLFAVLHYPLPSNFPSQSGWTVLSGPGPVTFADARASSTTASFQLVGTYTLQFTASQVDDRDPGNALTYTGEDTVTIEVRELGSPLSFDPTELNPIGSITETTGALTFNTTTLRLSGALTGQGQVATNVDGSSVAVFAFHKIDLTSKPTVLGSLPLVLASHGDLRIAADVVVHGGNGSGSDPGVGVAGGGDGGGGGADRPESPGKPWDGQGPGGSEGRVHGSEDFATGGGGFGGAGGDSSRPGGPSVGDRFLSSLSAGSGAGGTKHHGGGAGGGGIGFVANGVLEISSWAQIAARGGDGGSGDAHFTAGGGSGGGILLRGKQIVLNGTLNADGGNGGVAGGDQPNGGGGGGGRIAVYYQTSLDTEGSKLTAAGGSPRGSNATGQQGANGTIYFGLDHTVRANQWLAAETGISDPTPADWTIDEDRDGLDTRLEYALGGSTATHDAHLSPTIAISDQGEYAFIFNRRQIGLTPADYVVETSKTLRSDDWHPLAFDDARIKPHPRMPGFDQVAVPLPVDAPARAFRLRLR